MVKRIVFAAASCVQEPQGQEDVSRLNDVFVISIPQGEEIYQA